MTLENSSHSEGFIFVILNAVKNPMHSKTLRSHSERSEESHAQQ
jgi:hypothetical protein